MICLDHISPQITLVYTGLEIFGGGGKNDLVLLLKTEVSHFGTCDAIILLCYYVAIIIRIIKFASLKVWEHPSGVSRPVYTGVPQT